MSGGFRSRTASLLATARLRKGRAVFVCPGRGKPKSRAEDMPSGYQAGTSRVFQYTEDEYGKVADYATAYENSTGQRGPWSNVTSLLISG